MPIRKPRRFKYIGQNAAIQFGSVKLMKGDTIEVTALTSWLLPRVVGRPDMMEITDEKKEVKEVAEDSPKKDASKRS